jgi:EF-P lysine aminoacylase GenX
MKIKTEINNLAAYKKYLKIKQAIHQFLQQKGYLEIELPVLSPVLVPESYLEVFETEFRYFNNKHKLYLTPSPELFLKRLLAYGIGNCYCLGKSFRNHERNSKLHTFEFTMLEFYKIKSTYLNMAQDVLGLLQSLSQALNGKKEIIYQGNKISLEKWEKLTVAQAFKQFANIEADELFNQEKLINKAKEKGYVVKDFNYEDIFSQIYAQEIEPHLGINGYPTLIYDYPKEFAALAKLNPDNKTAQRFEFYIAGIELGDCYTELTDWKEQQKRFLKEESKRKQENKTAHPIDKGFIEALQYGLVECAGIAIGFDRLAMIFTNTDSIDQLKLINVL